VGQPFFDPDRLKLLSDSVSIPPPRVNHVLELVGHSSPGDLTDSGGGVAISVLGSRRVGHEEIEDFRLVALRARLGWRASRREEVAGEEKAAHEPAGGSRGRGKLIHPTRIEDDYPVVIVDVGRCSEIRFTGRISDVVELSRDRVEVRL
jgi:hypothetical protein